MAPKIAIEVRCIISTDIVTYIDTRMGADTVGISIPIKKGTAKIMTAKAATSSARGRYMAKYKNYRALVSNF